MWGVFPRSLSWRFLKMIAVVFCAVTTVAFLVDFFEFARRAAGLPGYTIAMSLERSALRLPFTMEIAVPFVVQFAAIGLLSMAARRSEFVVLRGAGLSALQFIAPLCVISFVLGILVIVVLNPVAVRATSAAKLVEGRISGVESRPSFDQAPLWMARRVGDELVVIGARNQRNGGLDLQDVTYLRFNAAGGVAERVDAKAASFAGERLIFSNATRELDERKVREQVDRYSVPIQFSQETFREQFGDPNEITFFDLTRAISGADETGHAGNPLKIRFYSLLCLPFLLVGMVLLSTPISIRFERAGTSAVVMGSAVLLGFSLHAVSVIVKSLGSAGILQPFLAASIPALIATSGGMLWLLQTEDG
jgi:lipopolysaccharide export system permease protein